MELDKDLAARQEARFLSRHAEKAQRTLGTISQEQLDRIVEAIAKAFSMAQKGDIVLLLGKSHENSIIYKDFVMPYDEIKEARKQLNSLNKGK